MKIGLLPLYIEFYDQAWPEIRPRLERFYESMAVMLSGRDLTVLRSGFCRIKYEFEAAIADFERSGAECLVTLHMAYSPSLESSDALAKTKLPIVVLDATENYSFDSSVDPGELMYNHGVHGVMDMCSLLRQNGKPFAIAAGHPQHSDVLDRAVGFVRAAVAAGSLRGSRVGTIGGSFDGMGDFAVSDSEMAERFGVTVVYSDAGDMKQLAGAITETEIDTEITRDFADFTSIGEIPSHSHQTSTRDGLAVRKWVERENLSAFTINFSKVGDASGLAIMPFMEASRAMVRGIGYAGEGDVLTAAFCGALMRGFAETSFIEIFCPDWRGNTLFISHMSEMNIALTAKKPELAVKTFLSGDGVNPVACFGCFKGGEAMYINVLRSRDGFKLFAAPVTMEAETTDNFVGNIRGWMRPQTDVAAFLEQHSLAGATHHSILVYGMTAEQIRFFGELLGMDVIGV